MGGGEESRSSAQNFQYVFELHGGAHWESDALIPSLLSLGQRSVNGFGQSKSSVVFNFAGLCFFSLANKAARRGVPVQKELAWLEGQKIAGKTANWVQAGGVAGKIAIEGRGRLQTVGQRWIRQLVICINKGGRE